MRLLDFMDPRDNNWLVVNQFAVIEGQYHRRPDIVVFVNGLPLGLIELKNAADEDTTVWNAYAQLQTYKSEIPSLLHFNAVLVASDGLQARIGSLTANQEWFKVWRTIRRGSTVSPHSLELEVLLKGVFDPRRFLELLQHFIAFEEDQDSGALHKIIAGYHQFHAVNAAVEETVRASVMSVGGPRVRRARQLLVRTNARRQAGRPSCRRGVAHAGQRQEPVHALLRRPRHPARSDGEPDSGPADRPQRSRRSALWPVSTLPRSSSAKLRCRPEAGNACANCWPWRAAAWCSRRSRSFCLRRAIGCPRCR